MSRQGNAPLSDDDIDDLLDALASFGATSVQSKSDSAPSESPLATPPTPKECVILRPQFGKPR